MNNTNNKLYSNWVTGFVNAEGSFTIKFSKSKSCKTGWFIQACFQIKIEVRDKDLLLKIKLFFNERGTIWIDNNKNIVIFRVHNLSNITKIIIPYL
jgi:hypothetical protein